MFFILHFIEVQFVMRSGHRVEEARGGMEENKSAFLVKILKGNWKKTFCQAVSPVGFLDMRRESLFISSFHRLLILL